MSNKGNNKNARLLDEYLASVLDMQQAETDPFFYTRLTAAMQKQQDWVFPVKPSWIVSALALLLLLNGFMAMDKFKANEKNGISTASALQNFAAAYDLEIQSTY